jgi:multidrug resistance efflux pump
MRIKALVGGVVLAAAIAAGLGFYWPFGRKMEVLKLPGLVEIQEVRLGSRIGGRVAEVLVSEGDQVKAGQVLVRIDAPELEAQREQLEARLREAESQLEKAKNGPRQEEIDSAQAALEAARARLKRLEAGSRVEEIRQARSEVDSALADSKLAVEDFERADRLRRQSASAQADYDLAKAAVSRTRGRTAMAQARLDLLLAGTRPEEIEEARAEMKRAQANHRLLLAGSRSEDIQMAAATAAGARAKLNEIEVNLKERSILAPELAVVEVLAVRKGDLVMPNQPILRVLRTADLWVKIYVPETDLGKVQLGQTVAVVVDSYPDRIFEGRVTQIASESEFTPRNVQSIDERRHQVFGVRVRIEDPQGVFKSGMAADVSISLKND